LSRIRCLFGWLYPHRSHRDEANSADDRSAAGDSNGFKAEKKDVSGAETLFPDNPARRVGAGARKEKEGNRVKAANESDVSGVGLG